MFGKKKQIMHRLNVIFKLFIVFVLCACSQSKKGITFHGEAQGTTYTIIVADQNVKIEKKDIDHLLDDFDRYLSLYKKDSYLSKINESQSFQFEDSFGYFSQCYFLTELLFEQTNQMIDPTLYPILNAWKLYTPKGMMQPLDEEVIADLMQWVGFDNDENYQIKFNNNQVVVSKKSPEVKFDFNAIAQGFSADVIAEFIESKGAQNYYVEIGGEILVKGKNPEGKKWKIGIDRPEDSTEEYREIQMVVSTTNTGIATSGTYRNFVEVDGQTFSHIFNPKTGRPVRSDVLSVTVFAPSAGLADGYATYFMLIGKEEITKFCKENSDVSAIVMYDDGKKIVHEVIGNTNFVINE